MNNQFHKSKNKVSLIVAVFAVFIGAFLSMHLAVAQTSTNTSVISWEQLKSAISNNTNVEVTLEKDLVANETITIPNGKSVTIKGGKTIYRDRNAKFLSMFNVEQGGELSLDKGVVLSAKSMSGGGESSCRLLKGWDQESLSGTYHEQPTEWVFIANKDGNRKSIAVENGEVVSKDANELWNAQSFNKADYADQIFTLDFSTTHNVMNKDMYVYTAKNNASQKYLVFDNSRSNRKNKLSVVDSLSGLPASTMSTVTFKKIGEDTPCAEFRTADGAKYIQLEKNGTDVFAWKSVNKTPFELYRIEETKAPAAQIEDMIYDKSDLNNQEGGFFIHNVGGTVNINGATIKDLRIADGDNAPKNIVPIYNEGGQFNMTAGSIENNKLESFAGLDSNVKGRELNEQFKKYPKNKSIGAVLFKNGCVGNISGGTIKENAAMFGSLFVDSSELNITGNTIIENNQGTFNGAAINVIGENKNGVTVDGENVEIRNNISWRNGTITTFGSFDGCSGRFTLENGKIHDNVSYDKGGAIRVKSNGVMLKGGEIYNNKSRVMGGAIYVDGDTRKNSRTLKLENGAIYGNKAVMGSNAELGGDTDVAFPKDNADGRDGYLQSGCGGGVWTCPFGTLVFNGKTVNIGDNTAERKNGGNDFHKDNGLSGALILSDMPDTWKNENGQPLPTGEAKPIEGTVNLTNEGTVDKNAKGVKIYNNISRRGGGVAANGTLIFGKITRQERNQAMLNFKKVWGEGAEKTPVKFNFSIVAEDGTKTELGSYTMNGSEASENDELDNFQQIAPWEVRILLPNSYKTKTGEKPFYDTGLKAGAIVKASDWKLVAEEVDTGNKYDVKFSDVKLDSKTSETSNQKMTDKSGNTWETTLVFNEFTFSQSVTNNKKPEVPTDHEIAISKTDISGNEIEGAKIVLTDNAGNTVDQWTSSKNAHKVNLKPGEYVFKETLAPEGFKVVTDITFTVGNDGKVTVKDSQAAVNKDGVLVVTDNYSTEKITVNVNKKWIGAEADKATVKLLANGKEIKTADLTKKNGWKASFDDLFKYDRKTGKKITYKVTEVANDAYTSKVEGSVEDGFTVTNTEKTYDVSISKADISGNEIEGAKIELSKDGKVVESWTSGKTAHKVNLKPGKYVFKETLAPEGFEVVTDITFTVRNDGKVTVKDSQAKVNQDGVLVVTDNYSTEKITVNVNKKWIGAEADKATVKLLANGKEIQSVDLTKDNGWKHAFDNLFKYDQKTGKKITYTVVEVANDAYTSKVEGNVEEGFTVTNTKKTHEITISKTDISGNEIEGAKIVLTDNAGNTVDEWTSTKTAHEVNLKPGKYVFKETLAPEGFEVVTDITFTVGNDGKVTVKDSQAKVNQDGVLVVTDNYSTEKITVNVNKKWIGAEADKATVKLLADGKEIQSVDLTKDNGWKHSFDNLFKYDQKTGKKITYTVVEVANDAYTSKVEGNVEEGFTVTNTKKTHEITISKTDISGNEIEGAKIVLTDNAGNTVDEWTSSKTAHKVNLKPGKYVFKETLAPEGFEVVTDITFTVEVDGSVVVNDSQAKVNAEGVLVVTDNYKKNDVPEKPETPSKVIKDKILAVTSDLSVAPEILVSMVTFGLASFTTAGVLKKRK